MSTKRKKLSFGDIIGEARDGLTELLVDRPTAWFAEARSKLNNLPKTNFDLGCHFARQNKWVDALFRFRVATYFAPDYPQVWYNIGCCYYRLNKTTQAEAALKKAIAQRPSHTEAVFMLTAINPAALSPAQVPKRMPTDMVDRFFSGIADSYDIEEARNQYQGGKVTYDALKPFVATPTPRVLDLGCGTGIAARPWRAAAAAITGVDSTAAMVTLAQKATHADKKLFDQLITADIAVPLPGLAPGGFEVVLCVNTSQFVGDLTVLMQNAANALAPGGVMLLTAEPYRSAGFGLSVDSGRFGHSADYVKQTAKAAGLTLAKELPLALYADAQTPAYILKKELHG